MAEKNRSITIRFTIVYLLVLVAFGAVVGKTIYIQTVERKPLLELAAKSQTANDTVLLKSERGNIYDCQERLLSASIPSYNLFMNTKHNGLDWKKITVSREGKKDTTIFFTLKGKNVTFFEAKLDSTAEELSLLFPQRTKQDYKTIILKARANTTGSNVLKLNSEKVSYTDMRRVQNMPLFRYYRNGFNLGGLILDTIPTRERPFGLLAARTLGTIWDFDQYQKDTIIDKKTGKGKIIYKTDAKTGAKILVDKKGSGRNGLEKYFDKALTGQDGFAIRKDIADGKNIVTKREPVAGYDIITTLDVDIQELAEAALSQSLDSLNARSACAIVMKTNGEIKACVNLFKTANGYAEIDNMAIGWRCDMGSTFKIFSMMLALDSGYVKTDDEIICDKSKYDVKDHTPRPFHLLTPAEIIMHSSNVGISNIITDHYKNPQRFIDDIYKTHFLDTMKIQIVGAREPSLNRVLDLNQYTQFHHIARITFGQSIEVAPIYTLRFYNAIANGGTMIEPRLVNSIRNGNKDIEVFSSKIINPKICSDSTLKIIKSMLEMVVNTKGGTGYKEVRSNIVKIAGKTGTADIEKNTKNFASFCGYFPADAPEYTVIVAMVVPHGIFGAGAAGKVFKRIAEGITTMNPHTSPQKLAADSVFNLVNIKKMPYIKDGNFLQFQTVANALKFSLSGNSGEWVSAIADSNSIVTKPLSFVENLVPNVCGMGAKDAVYLLESVGLRVRIEGYGKVIAQTILPGTRITRGATVSLKLE
ncbi:MAG: transpeptidase family protein [Paludibacter sp.]|nr:transpeptidase family protein [Paludibacter sp.]